MLSAMREQGWTFEKAWSSAIQRMRVAPDMDDDAAEELLAFKYWLAWAKPMFEWAYRGSPGHPPQLAAVQGCAARHASHGSQETALPAANGDLMAPALDSSRRSNRVAPARAQTV
jgi:hypothetical protein